MIGNERLWMRQRKTAGEDLTNGENAAAKRMEDSDSPTTFCGRSGCSAAVEPNSNGDQSETTPLATTYIDELRLSGGLLKTRCRTSYRLHTTDLLAAKDGRSEPPTNLHPSSVFPI